MGERLRVRKRAVAAPAPVVPRPPPPSAPSGGSPGAGSCGSPGKCPTVGPGPPRRRRPAPPRLQRPRARTLHAVPAGRRVSPSASPVALPGQGPRVRPRRCLPPRPPGRFGLPLRSPGRRIPAPPRRLRAGTLHAVPAGPLPAPAPASGPRAPPSAPSAAPSGKAPRVRSRERLPSRGPGPLFRPPAPGGLHVRLLRAASGGPFRPAPSGVPPGTETPPPGTRGPPPSGVPG